MEETKSTSQRRKMVRVVARVRPLTDPVTQASKSISVRKPKGDESESVSISFGAQFPGSKNSYKVDYCYEENETTGLILAKEIKPLINSVFEGKDANVIANGARCSGKTHLIQGSEKEPGIAVLTMAQMLTMAEERGVSISVSVYEVSRETVYDILHQEKREVSVLEDAQGKIQLKGLSQVPVKSLSEFQNLYFGLKKFQKLTSDPPLRSHRGVMIHVTTGNVSSGSHGRMNFLDIAGYEDSRKQNSGLAPLEFSRIYKSINALQNVMYALSANEPHVPYRESKLTHMLKDCLQGCNRTLLITCLPREFSQDSFHMLNLASRICLGSNRAMANHTKKKINTPASSVSVSSAAQRKQTSLAVSVSSKRQTGISGTVTERKTKLNTEETMPVSSAAQRKQTSLAVSVSSKKQTGISRTVTERKTKLNTAASAIKGRKLFGEAADSVKCKNKSKKMEDKAKMGVKKMQDKAKMAVKKEISTSKVTLNVQASTFEEEVFSSCIVTESQSSLVEEKNSASAFSSSAVTTELEVCSSSIVTESQSSLVEEKNYTSAFSSSVVATEPGYSMSLHETPRKDEERFSKDVTGGKGQLVERDNNNLVIVEDVNMVNEGEKDKENIRIASPPLSLRLQELSNTLKSMCKSSSVLEKYKSPVEELSEHSELTAEAIVSVELKTPERNMPPNIACSPWKTFSAHSSKLKKSAVGEYLKFLNTAEKDDLKKLKGIGEKRATYIVELREESPEPFKSLDDLKDIGLSEKQIKGLLRKEIGDIF